jgi:DNA mismatch repair protein MutH
MLLLPHHEKNIMPYSCHGVRIIADFSLISVTLKDIPVAYSLQGEPFVPVLVVISPIKDNR